MFPRVIPVPDMFREEISYKFWPNIHTTSKVTMVHPWGLSHYGGKFYSRNLIHICLDCCEEVSQTGWLIQHSLSRHSSEARRPRSRCQQGWLLLASLPGLLPGWLFLCCSFSWRSITSWLPAFLRSFRSSSPHCSMKPVFSASTDSWFSYYFNPWDTTILIPPY